jgi:diguanylate cyclase (GGDEF)-like protein
MEHRPTIGVLAHLVRGHYFGSLLRSIHQTARQAGARVIAVQTLPPWLEVLYEPGPVDFEPFAWDQIDGYIVITKSIKEADVLSIKQAGKPLVTISEHYPEVDCPAVLPDNVNGTLAAVHHLIDHGHQRIAFVGCFRSDDVVLRYGAYQQALRQRGIEPDAAFVYPTISNQLHAADDAAQRFIAQGLPCTAVFAGTDYAALDVMEVVQAAGYRVPQDLAIAGFDDEVISQHASPPLTTIRPSLEDIGATAARLVLAQVAGDAVPSGPVYVPTTFIQRYSCGCSRPNVLNQEADHDLWLGHDWADRLAQHLAARLLSTVPTQSTYPPAPAWPGASQLAAGLVAAMEGAPPVSAEFLSEAWHSALGMSANAETLTAICTLLARVARARADLCPDPRARERIDAYVQQTHMELIRACQADIVTHRKAIENMVLNSFRISSLLLSPEASSMHTLSWLQQTSVVRACLGRWEQPGDEQQRPYLTVTGSYSRDGSTPIAIGSRWPMPAFPPASFIDAPDDALAPGPVMLIPLRSASLDWGILAVVGPIENQFHSENTRGGIEQWATLLIPALEREALLHSLAEQREALRQRALHDGLTGLPNRTLFMDRLDQAMARSQRDPAVLFAVCFLDMNDFKDVNDGYGHLIGDQLLIAVAERLQTCLRGSDTLARLGGDEFVLLLDALDDARQAQQIAERIHQAMEAPFYIDESTTLKVTLSIGIVNSDGSHRHAEDLLRDADIAMYQSKARPPHLLRTARDRRRDQKGA